MAGQKDNPFDGRGGRIDVFVEISQAEIARRCAAFEPMLSALKIIAARDFDCAPHQHGMAAAVLAESAIAKAEGR